MTTNSDFRDIMQLDLPLSMTTGLDFVQAGGVQTWAFWFIFPFFAFSFLISFLFYLLSSHFHFLPLSCLSTSTRSLFFLTASLSTFFSFPYVSPPPFLLSSHPFLTSIMFFGLLPQSASPTPFPIKVFFPLFLDFSRDFSAPIAWLAFYQENIV